MTLLLRYLLGLIGFGGGPAGGGGGDLGDGDRGLALRVGEEDGKPVLAMLDGQCDDLVSGDRGIGLIVGEEDGKPIIAWSDQLCVEGKFEVGKRYIGLIAGEEDGKPIISSFCKKCMSCCGCARFSASSSSFPPSVDITLTVPTMGVKTFTFAKVVDNPGVFVNGCKPLGSGSLGNTCAWYSMDNATVYSGDTVIEGWGGRLQCIGYRCGYRWVLSAGWRKPTLSKEVLVNIEMVPESCEPLTFSRSKVTAGGFPVFTVDAHCAVSDGVWGEITDTYGTLSGQTVQVDVSE